MKAQQAGRQAANGAAKKCERDGLNATPAFHATASPSAHKMPAQMSRQCQCFSQCHANVMSRFSFKCFVLFHLLLLLLLPSFCLPATAAVAAACFSVSRQVGGWQRKTLHSTAKGQCLSLSGVQGQREKECQNASCQCRPCLPCLPKGKMNDG